MLIRSTVNPTVRRLKRLADSPRACRAARRTLIEGIHLLAAAQSAVRIHAVLLRATGASAEAHALARQVATAQAVDLLELGASLYDALSPVQHGAGVMAEIEYSVRPLPETLTEDAVYLDGVQDPGNVGALLRTAAAAGIRQALLGAGCAYAGAPRTMRAGMGAQFVLSVHDDVDPGALRRVFGGTILVAVAAGGGDLFEADWDHPPTLWIFGGEGQGVSAEAVRLAQHQLRIPIASGVESLNVAAAAAVCLFEQLRRRQLRSTR